jgi:preprotein translocase SecF subunit
MKPLRLVPDDTKIRFMRYSRYGFFISGVLSFLSILAFFYIGLNMGVDFKGGTTLTVRTQQAADIDTMRSKLNGLGIGSVELQQFGTPNDVLINFGAQEGGAEAQQAAVDQVMKSLGAGVELRSKEEVGPKVSGELTQQAILAVVISLICVMAYIWFQFEWQFAIGAIISLLHDVLLTIGLFCVIGLEFNLAIIAAILTIVGYSLNDTVVVFDRIREYLRKYKAMPLADLIDLSMNSVLPRTLMTSVSVLIALLALYLFGGPVINGFTFTMIWGVLIGTYSSIFMAAPVLIFLGTNRESIRERAKAVPVRS